jgi:hypothetical protein
MWRQRPGSADLTVLLIALVCSTASAAMGQTGRQRTGSPFEFQVISRFDLRPSRSDDVVRATRSPGFGIGGVFYSSLDDVVGLRLHADVTVYSLRLYGTGGNGSSMRHDVSTGIDAAPRPLRFRARSAEARVYGGAALRLGFGGPRDFACVGDPPPPAVNPCEIATNYSFGITGVGRIGVFILTGPRSPYRIDVAYQTARMWGDPQHEISVRLGYSER